MKRLFGLMPSSEIEKERSFRDNLGLRIIIQAGPHGYSIIYADSSTRFKDIDDTTEANFNRALQIVESELGKLKPERQELREEVLVEK